jgi:protein TonB
MNPTDLSFRRLVLVTTIVLVLHGLLIGAVYRAFDHRSTAPSPLDASALLVGWIELASAAATVMPTPIKVTDRPAEPSRPSPPAPTLAPSSTAPLEADHTAQPPTRPSPSTSDLPPSSTALADESLAGALRTSATTGAIAKEATVARSFGDASAASARSPVAAVAPAPGSTQLASSAPVDLQDADYLEPLSVTYPPQSARLREQGRVVVKVLIGTDGRAQQAEVLTSSGYPRLDQAALASVRAARFRPAQRGNRAEDGWYQVPVRFDLPR